jgi:ribosomal protein S18 acetylase RimI-like enzyme
MSLSRPLAHPLDRPAWSALTTGWSHLALGDGRALQLAPQYGPFAAAADLSPANMAALSGFEIGPDGLWLVETEETAAPPPGLAIKLQAVVNQMVAQAITPDDSRTGEAEFEVVALTEADAAEMRALAHLTRPGPFAERTHQLGDFIGVKLDGKLAAMAGERMRPAGFSEVSGVCTLPEHRGKGYAAKLMRIVARRILERGETPFLHAYASNTGAIRLYETLGFALRRPMIGTVLTKPPQD